MTYAFVLRPEAELELDEAYNWYEDQEEGLGESFFEYVNRILLRIAQRPESYGIVYRDVRRAVMNRFPYVIYYRLVSNQVIIISIFHGRRDPEEWQSRR